jgi:hypothetical protein
MIFTTLTSISNILYRNPLPISWKCRKRFSRWYCQEQTDTDRQSCSPIKFLFLVNDPAVDAMEAPQPWGLLCNPVMKVISFFLFSVQWNTVGIKLTGENRSTRGKTCPSATSSTTTFTWTDTGSKPGLRDERTATNRLCHGTAYSHKVVCPS